MAPDIDCYAQRRRVRVCVMLILIHLLTCNFCFFLHLTSQILKPSEKKAKYQYGGLNSGRPVTPPRAPAIKKK